MGLGIEERYENFLNACLEKDYEQVEDIIFDRSFRINVNEPLKDGANAIVIAAQLDDYRLVKLLLLNGADVNSTIEDGWSALMIAIRAGNYDIVKLMIDKNADINMKSPEGLTPLILASFCNNLEIVKLLVTKKADVNAVTKDNKNPLNQTKSQEIKDFLIENGAVDNSSEDVEYKLLKLIINLLVHIQVKGFL